MSSFLAANPYFYILLTLGTFLLGRWLFKITKFPLCNPLLLSSVFIIVFLLIFKIPVSDYQSGCSPLQYFLTPATICYAVSMFEKIEKLKKNLLAIVVGVLAGAVVSLTSIRLMSLLFHLDAQLTNSLLPKSITTAIAMPLTEQVGGIVSITITAIMISGLLGNIFAPILAKLFRFDDVSLGVAIGTSSHAIGTSRAIEISELCGAVSGLSLTFAGLITVILFSFFCM